MLYVILQFIFVASIFEMQGLGPGRVVQAGRVLAQAQYGLAFPCLVACAAHLKSTNSTRQQTTDALYFLSPATPFSSSDEF
jgi:hypothetical protein